MHPPDYDAVIIGGGPAGGAAALLLARAGWSIALVESAAYPRRKVCGEFLSATNLPLLAALGIADDFLGMAGPPVERVGLFAGNTCIDAPMPEPQNPAFPFGHALGRAELDSFLLNRAREAGADIYQPFRATGLTVENGCYRCRIKAPNGSDEHSLQGRIVIAAHGSWEPGTLLTQPARPPALASDLFGFKAHFRLDRLPPGMMPLLAFPGGYGGMVHTSQDRLSLSCCVRRDRLAAIRAETPGATAAEAVLAHIQASCSGARDALAGSVLDGRWLTVGPIRPGIRVRPMGGIFLVGNAAGEAHPVIAEGISIAIQSAWILANVLIRRGEEALRGGTMDAAAVESAAVEYAALWTEHFAARVRVSSALAFLAMHAHRAPVALRLLERVPQVLTLAASWSGKSSNLELFNGSNPGARGR